MRAVGRDVVLVEAQVVFEGFPPVGFQQSDSGCSRLRAGDGFGAQGHLGRVAQPFDFAGISDTVGAPSLRLCSGQALAFLARAVAMLPMGFIFEFAWVKARFHRAI